jgi:DNA-binding response OmpR family regulator
MADVLVIELSDSLRQFLLHALKHSGFRALGLAVATEQALQQTSDPNVVVVACHTPHLDDLTQLLTPVLMHRLRAGIPLVVLVDDAELHAHAIGLGASECLVRTWVDYRVLDASVQRQLRQSGGQTPFDECSRT